VGHRAELLKTEERLWTFQSVEGMPPTNNLAERCLRRAVIWRKKSFGTDSERGSRFVERILSVSRRYSSSSVTSSRSSSMPAKRP